MAPEAEAIGTANTSKNHAAQVLTRWVVRGFGVLI